MSKDVVRTYQKFLSASEGRIVQEHEVIEFLEGLGEAITAFSEEIGTPKDGHEEIKDPGLLKELKDQTLLLMDCPPWKH